MKKFLAMFMVVMFLLVGTAFALNVQVGGDLDFILKKQVELKNTGIDADLSAQYYDITDTIKLGNLTLTPKIGINHGTLEADVASVGKVEIESGIGWNAGIDAQYDVLQTKYADLALIGAYRYSRNDIDNIDINGLVIDNPIDTTIAIHQYSVGAMVSKDLSEIAGMPITPYFGVVLSDLQGDMDANLSVVTLNEEISAKDNVGIRFGIKADPTKDIQAALGVGLIDETSVTGKVTLKF